MAKKAKKKKQNIVAVSVTFCSKQAKKAKYFAIALESRAQHSLRFGLEPDTNPTRAECLGSKRKHDEELNQ